MKTTAFTNICSTCSLRADYTTPEAAINAAKAHVCPRTSAGRQPAITTTRPAHNYPGAVPVIVAITNLETHNTMIYTTDLEKYAIRRTK